MRQSSGVYAVGGAYTQKPAYTRRGAYTQRVRVRSTHLARAYTGTLPRIRWHLGACIYRTHPLRIRTHRRVFASMRKRGGRVRMWRTYLTLRILFASDRRTRHDAVSRDGSAGSGSRAKCARRTYSVSAPGIANERCQSVTSQSVSYLTVVPPRAHPRHTGSQSRARHSRSNRERRSTECERC